MADNIDFANEEFETTAMKPVSGEEANVLWARQMAGNLGHLYYSMPPLVSFDTGQYMFQEFEGTISLYFYKTLHKPSFFNEIKTYYLAYWTGFPTDMTFSLWIDGTSIIALDPDDAVTTKTSAVDTIGVLGNDEWLVATALVWANMNAKNANPCIYEFNFEVFPDWDNI